MDYRKTTKMTRKTAVRLIVTGSIGTLAGGLTAATGAEPTGRGTIHLEAEEGELVGTRVLNSGTGFSGKGYVGGFEADGTAVRFHRIPAAAGIYELRLRYRAPGQKGVDVVVNGRTTSAMLPASGRQFATQSIGKVELKAGENEVAIERGWGYYEIDALDLIPAPVPASLRPIPLSPVDPAATPEARQLLQFLGNHYGAKTLSGQHTAGDAAYIQRTAGVTPAIVSSDLIDFSPSRVAHGANPQDVTGPMIAAYRTGNIVSLMWHWNAPKDLIDKKYRDASGKEVDQSWYLGFYTAATTFDLAKALADSNSGDYKLLVRNIDTIAVHLKKMQDAGVPVLWRPLHEAEGGWFWWGAKGPGPFKQLWRLMYERLTKQQGLHNLIWVYTSGGNKDWYPGDDVVDVVGTDAYPSDVTDPLSGIWEDLLRQFDGRKMLALSEFGGVPDIDRMRRFGVRWVYFGSWQGDLGPKKVSTEELRRLYTEKSILNRDGIVGWATTTKK